MGLFKQVKQMKDVVAEAPNMVSSAMAMQDAQARAAQAAAAATTATGAPAGAEAALDDQAIAGLTLATYAAVCRAGTERGVTDVAGVAAIARERGIDQAAWEAGMNGWNARFATDPTAAMRFNTLWRGVG